MRILTPWPSKLVKIIENTENRMSNFIQGLILGFVYVMPIGAQNIFVINTALRQRRSRTLLTALIVFLFDISLAIACFFGVGAILQTATWLKLSVLCLGSLIVIYIGFSIFVDKNTNIDSDTNVNIPITKVLTTAFVVTWLNPQALIDGSLMLGAFHASMPGYAGALFISGVCIASFLWWFGMSSFVSLFKAKISSKILRIINIVCGAVIIFYGAKLFVDFIKMLMPIIKG